MATKSAAAPSRTAATKTAGTAAGTTTAKPMTKTEVLGRIAVVSGQPKTNVAAILEALTQVIGEQLGKKGPGVFQIPGLVKFKVVRKPAVKAKKGINPFTKEEMVYAAKPAQNVVRMSRLKALKEMV